MRIRWLIGSRRLWLALGVLVAGFVALCLVSSVSLLPPSLKSRSLGYALASAQLYVAPSGGLVNNPPGSVIEISVDQTIALASVISSPKLTRMIAADAGVDPSRLAIDGPLNLDTSVFQQQPSGEKRASQVIVQNVPDRVTIDEDLALPEMYVTTQAPTSAAAVSLASATQRAVSTYLTGVQTSSQTPVEQRLRVSAAGPISVTDAPRKDLVNLAVLGFALTFALWAGLVIALSAVARDVRSLGRGSAPGRASP